MNRSSALFVLVCICAILQSCIGPRQAIDLNAGVPMLHFEYDKPVHINNNGIRYSLKNFDKRFSYRDSSRSSSVFWLRGEIGPSDTQVVINVKLGIAHSDPNIRHSSWSSPRGLKEGLKHALKTGDYYGGMMLERRGIYNQGADFKMYMVDTIERLVRINEWVCWKIDLWRLQGVNSDNSALFYRSSPNTELRCPLNIDGDVGYLILDYGITEGYSLKYGQLFPVQDFNAIMPELEKAVANAIRTIEYTGHTISQPQPLDNDHHKNIDTFGENIKVTHYPTAHLRVTGYSSSGVKDCVENPCVYRHLDLRKSNGDPSGLYHDESMYSTIKIKNRPWSLKLRLKGLELQSAKVREGVVYQSLKAHQPYDSSPTYIDITVSENFCEDEGASSDIDQQTQCVINTIPLKEGQRLRYPPKSKESTLSRTNEPANEIYFVKEELSPNGGYKKWALIQGFIFRKGDDWVWLRGYTRPKRSRLDFANLALMNKYLSIIDHSSQE